MSMTRRVLFLMIWANLFFGLLTVSQAAEDPSTLIAELSSSNHIVRAKAAYRIGRMGSNGVAALPRLVELLTDTNKCYWTDGYGSTPTSPGREAAKALGRIRDKRAVIPLITSLKRRNGKDEDAYFRSEAVKSLGQLGDSRAVKPLVSVVVNYQGTTGARPVRWTAAHALAKLGKPGLNALLDLLVSERESARAAAALALDEVASDDRRIVPALIKALTDPDRDVCKRAADSLGRLRATEAIGPLITMLSDTNSWKVLYAESALERITGEELGDSPKRWEQWLNSKQ